MKTLKAQNGHLFCYTVWFHLHNVCLFFVIIQDVRPGVVFGNSYPAVCMVNIQSIKINLLSVP